MCVPINAASPAVPLEISPRELAWDVSFSTPLLTITSREGPPLSQLIADRVHRQIDHILHNNSDPFPRRFAPQCQVSVAWESTRIVAINRLSSLVSRIIGPCIVVLLRSKSLMSLSHVTSDVSHLQAAVQDMAKAGEPIEAFLAGGWNPKSNALHTKIRTILLERSILVREDLCLRGIALLNFQRADKPLIYQGAVGLRFAGFDKDGNPRLRFGVDIGGVQKKNVTKYAWLSTRDTI